MTSTAPSAIALTEMTLTTSVGSTPVKLLPIAISSSFIRAPTKPPGLFFTPQAGKLQLKRTARSGQGPELRLLTNKTRAACGNARFFGCSRGRALVGWGAGGGRTFDFWVRPLLPLVFPTRASVRRVRTEITTRSEEHT